MEILLKFIGILLRIINAFVSPILVIFGGFKRVTAFPQIQNEILEIPAVDLAERIRNKELRSEDLVRAYINRIKEVNPLINAVIEDRYTDAIGDAKKADQMVAKMPIIEILTNYPLLGVPFTVKESCGLGGLSQTGGSLPRLGRKAAADGDAVANLKAAGCIPLLVSNTPEYCLSWETNNHITGLTTNPYDHRRSPGGSSGGEASLLGAGGSLFGVASDIAGSIRVPAMFNGVFGHKPTAGVVSVIGHFPVSTDENFQKYLTIGPMCRYSKDLATLLHIMSGPNANKLRLHEIITTKNIKIFYMEDIGYSIASIPVNDEIKMSLFKAVKFFKDHGLSTERAEFDYMEDSVFLATALFFSMDDIPDLFVDPNNSNIRHNIFIELGKALFGKSRYTLAGIGFYLLYMTRKGITASKLKEFRFKRDVLRKHIVETLGDDGVLLFPTNHSPALRHHGAYTNISGVVYTMIFNILGLPATHVPLGLDKSGLPIGIQVVAAPYQDRLCLCIARELEAAFGGWKAPK